MRRAAILIALAAVSCEGDVTRVQVDIDLVNSGVTDCTPLQLGTLRHVEVDLYGLDESGQRCLLDRACVTLNMDTSFEQIEERLRNLTQPLVSTDEEATQVGVRGYVDQTCGAGNNPRFCGVGELAAVDDEGKLTIDMTCDPLVIDLCPVGEGPVPPCP